MNRLFKSKYKTTENDMYLIVFHGFCSRNMDCLFFLIKRIKHFILPFLFIHVCIKHNNKC